MHADKTSKSLPPRIARNEAARNFFGPIRFGQETDLSLAFQALISCLRYYRCWEAFLTSQARLLLIAGAVLDTLGVALIALSFVQETDTLYAGLVLMAAGSVFFVLWGRRNSRDLAGDTAPQSSASTKGWTPERELTRPLPRQVVLTPVGRWRTLLWMLALAAAVIYTNVIPGRATPRQETLQRFGVEVTGVIHRKESRSHDGAATAYYLYYNFKDANGKGVRASAAVGEQVYSSFQEGDSIEITYLAEDPFFHEAKGFGDRSGARPLGYPWVALLTIAIVALEIHRIRHKRLAMYGKAVAGNVTKLTRLGAATAYSVECTAGGRRRKLRGSERRPGLRVGDPVTVLYMPDKPQHIVLYRLCLYRAG